MIVEIDTTNKIIKVKGTVNLRELFSWLMTNFEFEWEKWTISEYPMYTSGQDYSRGSLIYKSPIVGPGSLPGVITSPGTWTGDDPNAFKVY